MSLSPGLLSGNLVCHPATDHRLQLIHLVRVVDLVMRRSFYISQVRWRGAGQTDLGHFRLTGTIDDTADHSHIDGRRDVFQARLQLVNDADDVEVLSRTTGACHQVDALAANPQALEDV